MAKKTIEGIDSNTPPRLDRVKYFIKTSGYLQEFSLDAINLRKTRYRMNLFLGVLAIQGMS